MKTLFICMFILFVVTSAKAEVVIDIDKIGWIESRNNPLAYNKYSGARGKYQITPIVLKEYNQFNNVTYTLQELFNDKINRKIAEWYLFKRIPSFLRYYKQSLTIENYLICYSAGIKRLLQNRIPKETKQYIYQYKNLALKKH